MKLVMTCTNRDCPKVFESCERKDCAPTKGMHWNDLDKYKPLIWEPPYIKKQVAYKSDRTEEEYSSEPFVFHLDDNLTFNRDMKEHGRDPIEGELLNGYNNHGFGGVYEWHTKDKNGNRITLRYLDLPKEQYPYSNVYVEDPEYYKPVWMRK